MKKILLVFIAIFTYIVPSYADLEHAKSNAVFIAAGFEKKGYEFREFDEEYSGNLIAGESGYITLNLFKGLDYAIIVGGSAEAKQMVVSIYDENWKEVARSPEKSSVVIEFTPKATGAYYMKIEMVNAAAKGADWIQLLGYKGRR